MTSLVIISIVVSYVVTIYLLLTKMAEDKKATIREISKVFLSKNLEEYASVIPEEEEIIEEEPEDEFVEIGTVDANVLLKNIRKEYEDFQN